MNSAKKETKNLRLPSIHSRFSRAGSRSALAWIDGPTKKVLRVPSHSFSQVGAWNASQQFAFYSIGKRDLELIAISGPPNSGKTFLVACAALELNDLYDGVYLTSTLLPPDEYYDVLKEQTKFMSLEANDKLAELVDDGKFEFGARERLGSRRYDRRLVILDDAHALAESEAKRILLQAGIHSKYILMGRLDTGMDTGAVGYPELITRLAGKNNFAHILLREPEESSIIASLARDHL